MFFTQSDLCCFSSKANNAFFSDSLPMSQSGKFIPNFTSKNSARSKKLAVTDAKSLQIVQRKSVESEITVGVVKDGEKSIEEEVCGSEEVLKKMPPLRNMQKKTKRKSVVKVEGKSNVKTNQPEICDDTGVSRLIIPCLEDIKKIDESKVRKFGHNDEDLSEDIEIIMKETIDEICKDAINVNLDNPELVANLLDGSLAEKDSSYHDVKNNQTESDGKFDGRKENLKMLDDAEINNESTDNKEITNENNGSRWNNQS